MKIFNIATIIILYSFFFIPLAYGQTMSNSSYILEQGGLNSFSGSSINSSNKLTSTGGKIAPGVYEGNNYIVRANYFYGESASSSAFLFSISNTSINFGIIKPGDPVVRTNTLTIVSPDSGYQITASENNALKNSIGAQIPDTTCDSGNCTETTSAAWTSPLTYGFGYRCDNQTSTDCSSSFSQSTYFMPYANSAISETPQSVMSNISPTDNSQGNITYKLNVSGSQPSGVYQNVIQYIAVPSL